MARLVKENICDDRQLVMRNDRHDERWERTLGLEIPVNESHEMQVFERSSNLCGVEASIVLGNAFSGTCLKSPEELTTAAVFHAEVKIVLGLEGVIQSHNEGMVACSENFLLGQSSLNLVALDHFLLAQDCFGLSVRGWALYRMDAKTYPS